MNCPVCNRTLAPTLSICLTCGAMMNDSVREELHTKIGVPTPRRVVAPPPPPAEPLMSVEPRLETAKREIPRPDPPLRRTTNPLNGAKTSATLVGFQSKNAALPDWRLQLQNSVRQRKVGGPRTEAETPTRLVTQGATALKAEIVEESRTEPTIHSDPRIENALKRIDQSRKTFLPEKKPARPQRPAATGQRSYPFDVVTPNRSSTAPKPAKPIISEPPKPSLVPTFKIEKKKFDTNKLPSIVEEPAFVAGCEPEPAVEKPVTPIVPVKPDISISARRPEMIETDSVGDEIEDLASVSVRFNAGLFDLIIGAFGSFALVSPFVLMGADWFTLAGGATFVGVCGIVNFMYLTIGIGMYGKTLGMRMFGLELIDADASDYPTFHQAAVNSAVFLLMLPVLGAGFIPMIFNEERRAFHDLAAGTIIVTEF